MDRVLREGWRDETHHNDRTVQTITESIIENDLAVNKQKTLERLLYETSKRHVLYSLFAHMYERTFGLYQLSKHLTSTSTER